MPDLDLDHVSELEVDETVNDMHYELIIESIMEQLREPFNASYKNNNFLKIYEEKYNLINNIFEDDETKHRLRAEREETYLRVITSIEEHFKFEISKDEINIYDTGKCLYEFFIINYYKSMVKFFINFINKNKKDIAEFFKNNSTKDVSTSNLKKCIKDKNMIIILLNIQNILLKYTKSYNMDYNFLKYIIDFEANPIYDEINHIFFNESIITYNQNLFDTFFQPLFKKQDGYTNVIIDVHDYLYMTLTNHDSIPIDRIISEDDDEDEQ